MSRNIAAAAGGGVYLYGNGTQVVIENCRISNNSVTSLAGSGSGIAAESQSVMNATNTMITYNSGGAGIHSMGSSIVLTRCKVTNNVGTRDGGGVSVLSGSKFTAVATGIANNNAAGSGAGVYAVDSDTVVQLDNCSVVDNVADVHGGGAYITGGAVLTAQYSDLSHNNATSGGAVYMSGNWSSAVLRHCSVIHNYAYGAQGSAGGVYAVDMSTLELDATNITNNTAVVTGGAVYCDTGAAVTMTTCHLDYNTATEASGLYNKGTTDATDCSLNHNEGSGGGLHNYGQFTGIRIIITYNKGIGVHTYANSYTDLDINSEICYNGGAEQVLGNITGAVHVCHDDVIFTPATNITLYVLTFLTVGMVCVSCYCYVVSCLGCRLLYIYGVFCEEEQETSNATHGDN